jgi:3-dehydroquinate dehydratase type I
MICLSLTAKTLDANLAQLLAHRDIVDVAELRADLLSGSERRESAFFPRMAARSGCALPMIFTIRRQQDGGAFDGPEDDRLGLIERAAGGGYRYLDLEADLRTTPRGRLIARSATPSGFEIIRSLHAVDNQPSDITGLLRDLADDGREIAHLAVAPEACEISFGFSKRPTPRLTFGKS